MLEVGGGGSLRDLTKNILNGKRWVKTKVVCKGVESVTTPPPGKF